MPSQAAPRGKPRDDLASGARPMGPIGAAAAAALAEDSTVDPGLQQLWSCCSALESQLHALQAAHTELRQESAALRKCLERSGVLSSRELERELEPASARAASEAPKGPPRVRREADGRRSPSPKARGRSADLAPQRAVPARQMAADRGRSASARRQAEPPPASGVRSRSMDLDNAEGAVHSQEAPSEQQEEALFNVLQPLLEVASGSPEYARGMQAFQEHLRSNPAPPSSWSGPGTPLNAAVRAGNTEAVRLLLRSRANTNSRDHKGVSALHLAVFEGNPEMVQLLLGVRADIDAGDRHGQTPLFFAPSREICKLLLDKRADAALLNRKGQTALHLAGRAGLYEVLACLSTRVSKQVSELRDMHGNTAKDYLQQLSAPQQASQQAFCRGGAKRPATGTQKEPHNSTPRQPRNSTGAAKGRTAAPCARGDGHLSHHQLAARMHSSARGVEPHPQNTGDELRSLSSSGQGEHFDWSKAREAVEHFYLSNGSDHDGMGKTPPDAHKPQDDSPVPIEAVYGGLDGYSRGAEGEMVRSFLGKTALEAAAAVATAAMATAAELKLPEEAKATPQPASPPAEEEQPVLLAAKEELAAAPPPSPPPEPAPERPEEGAPEESVPLQEGTGADVLGALAGVEEASEEREEEATLDELGAEFQTPTAHRHSLADELEESW